jgi:hypothetical protein
MMRILVTGATPLFNPEVERLFDLPSALREREVYRKIS